MWLWPWALGTNDDQCVTLDLCVCVCARARMRVHVIATDPNWTYSGSMEVNAANDNFVHCKMTTDAGVKCMYRHRDGNYLCCGESITARLVAGFNELAAS